MKQTLKNLTRIAAFAFAALFAAFSFTACNTLKLKNADALATAQRPKLLSKDDWRGDRRNNPVSAKTAAAIRGFSMALPQYITTDGSGEGNPNAVFSPISLWSVLAMAAAGASGETLAELETAMGADIADIMGDYPALYRQLNAKNPKIALQNSVWFSKNRARDEGALRKLTDNFLADVYAADFGTADADADIQKWIKHSTRDMLNPAVETDPDLVLMLLDALAYEAEWKDPFKSENNVREDFLPRSGAPLQNIEYMRTTKNGGYHWVKDTYVSASLPFAENFGSMVFILPDEGVTCEEILSGPDLFAAAFAPDGNIEVRYKIPKFEFTSKWDDLIGTARSLGVSRAFDPSLSQINFTADAQNQYISKLWQAAYIKADEKGVKAAAVTGGHGRGTSSEPPKDEIDLFLTRPFIAAVAAPLWTNENKEVQIPLFVAVVNVPN